jgi:hypothetical protein
MPLDLDTETEDVHEEYFLPSTIENIDAALTEYLQELNIFCTRSDGWKKVPIIWTSAERSFQVKNNKDIRDSNGVLIKPVITIERIEVRKDLSKKGKVYAALPNINDLKGGVITIGRQMNQEKTSNFLNAQAKRHYNQRTFKTTRRKKIVYETVTIPIPVNLELIYNITLHAEYQQQINEMITPFITVPGGVNLVIIEKNKHRYEAFIESNFSNSNNLSSLSSDERKYETKVDVRVLGYLIGEDKNQEQPKVVRRQNAVEVKIPRERVVVGDINEIIKKGFYRE